MNLKQSTLANENYAKKDRNEEEMDKFKKHIGLGASAEAQHIQGSYGARPPPSGSGLLVDESDAHLLPPNMPNFDPTAEK